MNKKLSFIKKIILKKFQSKTNIIFITLSKIAISY